jgi:hypothetical protein
MRFGVFVALMMSAVQVLAWSNHAMLLWPVVRESSTLTEARIVVEPLESFVRAESAAIATVLDEVEQWSMENIESYPVTPPELRFKPTALDNIHDSFLRAIRVNPDLDYGLFRQGTIEDADTGEITLDWSQVSFLRTGSSTRDLIYYPLSPGDLISPAHVLISANDEPDHGMDVGLYVDNGTSFGAVYGFGSQPFGNPNLDYSSQAPFHMGFYHLDWLTKRVESDLLRTLPAWRIHLYQSLAALAFETGHDYWGWRFMGWALHYIGDLTQPYHADPLPGVSLMSSIWLVIQGKTADAIQLVSNRHGVLESYQLQRTKNAQSAMAWQGPLMAALSFDDAACLRSGPDIMALTADSKALGDHLDHTLAQQAPPRFVDDATFEWVGSGYEAEVDRLIGIFGGEQALASLDEELLTHLQRFSFYASGWVNQALAFESGALDGCI